ncbi:amino acid adenylation domain-containing protein [Streptomyces sp. NPDC005374]|uniref:amino acid adenylation domain-containing protein n=1 Tax=Streptomyces sp. NPDC005374 TaxID=3364713 RepID=UPI0036827445
MPDESTLPSAPLRSVMIGEHSLLAGCAALWVERGHRLTALVSPNPELRTWAQKRDIPGIERLDDLEATLKGEPFDYLFSITNMRIVPQRLLDLPLRFPVNFHDALLPQHAGVYATSWALLDSPSEHGVTWHVMTAGTDEGDILLQRRFTVGGDDTAYSLNAKCFQAGMESFAELADILSAGHEAPVPQDAELRTYHGRGDVLPDGGMLRWTHSGRQLHALVRATCLGRSPNAFGTAKLAGPGEFVVVGESRLSPNRSGQVPGTLLAADGSGLMVATADHDLTVRGFSTPEGVAVPSAELVARWGLECGGRLAAPDAAEALVAQMAMARPHEFWWVRRLARARPFELPHRGAVAVVGNEQAETPRRHRFEEFEVPVPPALVAVAADPAGTVLAAVLLFLARVSGEEQADVGFRGRERAGNGPLFASAVPIRIPEPAEGRSFGDFRAEAAEAVAAAEERGSTHLRDIWIRYPALGGNAGQHRPAVVVGIGGDVPEAGDPAAALRLLLQGITASVLVAPRGDRCRWFVAADRVEAAAVEALRKDFSSFLGALGDARHLDVARVPLLSGPRRQEVLEGWNSTRVDRPRRVCVHDMVAEQARRRPEAVAVVCDRETLTYRQLDARADRLAAALAAAGVRRGSLVGVYLGRSADLVVGLLAVLKAGAAYVPLDPVYPPDRIRAMAVDAGVRLVLTESRLPLPMDGIRQLEVRQPDIEGAGAAQPASGAPDNCRERETVPGADDAHGPLDGATPDDLAYVIYTSGSTGQPKGVRIAHRALTNLLCSMAADPGCTDTDRLLAVTTVCFDIAALELFLPLITGGSVELVGEQVTSDGYALRARLSRSRPTMMQATPATWRMLIAAGWEGDPELRALCGGEALSADLAAGLLPRTKELWNLYGPTETTIWSAACRVRPGDRITLGRPIENTRFYVMDRRGQPVPPYVPGELYIGGDGVADGYHMRPELTAERFVPDGLTGAGCLYRTGDLVRYLADGRLEYLNRIDDQVKVRGYRIELGEIEAALLRHDGVQHAVAVAREDVVGIRRLVAYLVPAGPTIPTAAELRRHLSRDLPSYMVPAVFVPVTEIPLTRNGKVDRKALPEPPRSAEGVPSGAAPSTGSEEAVAAVWRATLGRDDIGVDDSFFEAGGNSLLLVETVKRLNAAMAVHLTSVDMFHNPTVRSMAGHLEALARPEGDGQAVVSARRIDRSLIHRRRRRT